MGAHVVAVVIAGGPIQVPRALAGTLSEVVAVDGGLDAALQAGLCPTRVVGDLDSVTPAGLAWARERGVPIAEHPVDKDDTDTALALADIAARGDLAHTHVVVLGSDATDRFDHLLGTISALGEARLAGARRLTAFLGATAVHVLHPGHRLRLDLEPDRTLSLLALHGPCAGVHVSGVRWPLHDHELRPGSTLGISNRSVGASVEVAVGEGVLTVVIPPAVRS